MATTDTTPAPQKYTLTATESMFGGRQSIRLSIAGGPSRTFTQRIGEGKEAAGEDRKSVEVTLTREQALSVEQAGYEVDPSPSAHPEKESAKSKAASTESSSSSSTSTPTTSKKSSTSTTATSKES